MQEWTDNAKEILQNYLEKARKSLEMSEVDANEVIDDLRRHIDEEVIAANLQIITKEDIEKIIANLKITEPEKENCKEALNVQPEDSKEVKKKKD